MKLIIFIIKSSKIFVLLSIKTFEIDAIFDLHNTPRELERRNFREDMNTHLKATSNVHVAIGLQFTANQCFQI